MKHLLYSLVQRPLLWALLLLGFSARPGLAQGNYPAMECYLPDTNPTDGASRLTTAPALCEDYSKYAPVIADHTPIKHVRIAFHVFQDANGNGNWQNTPAHLGILRGFIDGLTDNLGNWYGGVNHRFGQLAPPSVTVANPTPYILDSRIRFDLEDIYFHQNTNAWNQSNNNAQALSNEQLYTTYVTNNAALSADKRNNVLHIFLTENPQNGYGCGGIASGLASKRYIKTRSYFWSYFSHPGWSTYQGQTWSYAADYIIGNIAHELTHSLGHHHVWVPEGCTTTPYNDPPSRAQSGTDNNLMNYGGWRALTACQIGRMHYYLISGAANPWYPNDGHLDDILVRDYYITASETVTIPANTNVVWESAKNLKGDLYVEPGATLTIRCRVGFPGFAAKIVIRKGGRIILDQGSISTGRTGYTASPYGGTLVIGGDPSLASDANNQGLFDIVNNNSALFPNLYVQLAKGAEMHFSPTAVVNINNSTLRTEPGSRLCVESGAQLTFTGTNARLDVDQGTIMGVSGIPAANCLSSVCALAASAPGAVPSEALSFAGSQAVRLPNNNTGMVNLGTQFTIEAYYQASQYGTGSSAATLFSTRFRNASNIITGVSLMVFPSGGSNYLILQIGGMNYGYNTPATVMPTDGACHHVAVTRDAASQLRFYLDGQLLAYSPITTRSAAAPGTTPLIGGDRLVTNGVNYFNETWVGHIGELRVWSVARSSADIQANLTSRLSNQPGLLACYDMQQFGSTQYLVDLSTVGATGVLGSSTSAETTDPTWISRCAVPCGVQGNFRGLAGLGVAKRSAALPDTLGQAAASRYVSTKGGELLLSPNPGDATATLSFTQAVPAQVRVSIVDLVGTERQLVLPTTRLEAGEQRLQLQLRELPTGVYLVVVESSAGKQVSRLQVKH